MAFAFWSTVCYALLLTYNASALLIRDGPGLNATTTTTTEDPAHKQHIESSVTQGGFETDTTGFNKETPTITSSPQSIPDVGSIIATAIASDDPLLVHQESSALSFEDTTQTAATVSPNDAQTTDHPNFRPHEESTQTGFDATTTTSVAITTPANAVLEQMSDSNSPISSAPSIPTVTIKGNVLQPDSITSVVVGSQTLVPGGETATIGYGESATLIYIDPKGGAVVAVGSSTSTVAPLVTLGDTIATVLPSSAGLVLDSQTLSAGGPPITVSSGSGATTLSIDSSGHTVAIADGATSTIQAPATQALTIGDITATAIADNIQYVIGSSTLALDHPITVDDTVISLTTDSSGATVLVADGSSSTLALAAPTEAVGVSTTVRDGTTEYVVGSQTLAPGHPITVNGQAMSITTSADQTILVVGTMTTTIAGPATTTGLDFAATSDLGEATPGTLGEEAPSPTSTNSKKGDADIGVNRWSVAGVVAIAGFVAICGLG